MMFFGCNISSANSLKCVSMSNQECKTRPEIIKISNNKPSFYLYSIKVNKCSGSCNNINDPYSKIYVPDVVKNINLKLRWYCTRDLLGSQILVTTGGFKLRIFEVSQHKCQSIQSNVKN